MRDKVHEFRGEGYGRRQGFRIFAQALALSLCAALTPSAAVGAPTREDLLEYAAGTLLLNIASHACGRGEMSDEDRGFYARQYYAILYILWFSEKIEGPGTSEMVVSKLEGFTRDFGGCRLPELVDRDDPLGILALEAGDIAGARVAMAAGGGTPYWDWVISKNQDKADYLRHVKEFNLQIDSIKQTPSP